jgi:D-alanine-D-alanine ligase
MSSLTIGLVYETFETYPHRTEDPVDAHVEFEPESTIEALESAIEGLGCRSRRLGSPAALLAALGREADNSDAAGSIGERLGVDAAFNLAEGFGGRNREAWAPVLLEMAGVPTLGSDALTLSLTLDKTWANRWARASGIAVAAQTTFASGREAGSAPLPADFPLFVKPRWEGTAKGIRASSRVEDRNALVEEVERICSDYDQPALVEAFVPGAEYTVTLIGNDPVCVLPVVQRALESVTKIGLHALEGPGAGDESLRFEIPGDLDPDLERRLASEALRVFEAFDCRDFARVDFRLDARASPIFLEINPLPTFATDGTFAILAELEGVSHSQMLGRCISAGLERLGLRPDRSPEQD